MAWIDHVREIRADPDADAPRLVCADWLLDRDDPRGEYIVLACRLARMTPGTPEHDSLEARRRQLETEHAAGWLAPIVELGAQGFRRDLPPRFARGFVETITLVGRASASFAEICAREPITDVTFVSCGVRTYELIAALPELAQIRELVLRGTHVLGCEALVASPHLGGVRRLTLPNRDPSMLAALAAGSARPERFTVGNDVPSLRRLVDAGFFARIHELGLDGLTDDGAAVIAEAALPLLRTLELGHPQLTAAGMTALGPHLARLEQLAYNGIAPAPGAVPVLTEVLAGGNLRALSFANFTCDALADLLVSPALANVESLHLVYDVFTPRIAEALRASPHRTKLRFLLIRVGDGRTPTGYTLDGTTVDDHDEPT